MPQSRDYEPVCRNHVSMNQIYAVSTEAVCPSRKSTVCSSPYTNINNMRISTSAKLPSKAMKTSKHPRKVLKIAYINICSRVHEINNMQVADDIHILSISETHLDNTFDDKVVAIQGHNITENTEMPVVEMLLFIFRTTFL